MTRICIRCKEEKPINEFVKRSERSNRRKGYRTHCKVCHSNCERLRRQRNGNDYHRNYLLVTKYGLTLRDYDQMFVQQNGQCALCGTSQPGGRWNRFHVDHDHQSNKVRSLLCNKCNQGIGLMNDDPELLEKAAEYIRTFREIE